MNIRFLKYLKDISSPCHFKKTFDEYMFSQILKNISSPSDFEKI